MHGNFIWLALLATSAIAAPTNATEQPAQTSQAASAKPSDGLICEKEIVTGSRLGGKEVCATAEERAARRLQERQAVERAQAMPCLPVATDSQGHAHC
jgi:hypothetical protein